MEFNYDLRLTIRNMTDTKEILKQYMVTNYISPVPISTKDKLILGTDNMQLTSEPVTVHHSVPTKGAFDEFKKSYVSADILIFEVRLSDIENIVQSYDHQEF